MLADVDLAGWASVLVAVSTLLGAVNAVLSTVLHRRAKENRMAIDAVQSSLDASNLRVEGTYQQMIEESKGLLAYIQGLNTPTPGGR